jgi:hypothetical protein
MRKRTRESGSLEASSRKWANDVYYCWIIFCESAGVARRMATTMLHVVFQAAPLAAGPADSAARRCESAPGALRHVRLSQDSVMRTLRACVVGAPTARDRSASKASRARRQRARARLVVRWCAETAPGGRGGWRQQGRKEDCAGKTSKTRRRASSRAKLREARRRRRTRADS